MAALGHCVASCRDCSVIWLAFLLCCVVLKKGNFNLKIGDKNELKIKIKIKLNLKKAYLIPCFLTD